MKRSVAVALLLMAAACDEDRRVAECTEEADGDVDCMAPDGGHSEGTKQAYYIHSGGVNNNAFLWYWLGTQNARGTVYVTPPAAYSPPPARVGPSYAASARSGFGATGHGAASGGGE